MKDTALVIISTLLIGMTAGWLSLYLVGRWWRNLRLRKGMGEAVAANEEAAALLEAKGFKVIDRQRRSDIITYVDGKPHMGFVQADFLASKRDKIYVAEVRTGSHVGDVNDPAVRRQLLEYNYVYKPDGILVVDMVERRIHLVDFGLPEEKKERFALVVVGLIILSVLAGLIWMYISVKLF